MLRARVSIALISTDFLNSSFCQDEEVPVMLERARKGRALFLPILLSPCFWQPHVWLRDVQMLPRDNTAITKLESSEQEAQFAQITRYIYEWILADTGPAAARTASPGRQEHGGAVQRLPSRQVDLSNFPLLREVLQGRERLLHTLDNTLHKGRTRLVLLNGFEGVGKSILLRTWLERLETHGFADVTSVFAWSFDHEANVGSLRTAEPFLNAALKFFDDEDSLGFNPNEKAIALAGHMRRSGALLVLDGLERFQDRGISERGRVLSPALEILLADICRSGPDGSGLLVATVRDAIPSLVRFVRAVDTHDLENLQSSTGGALLKLHGVGGDYVAREELSFKLGNHALALRLFAGLVKLRTDAPEVVLDHVFEAGPFTERAALIERLLELFDETLEGRAAADLLRLLALFDGETDFQDLWALFREGPLPDLAPVLSNCGTRDRLARMSNALRELKAIGLLDLRGTQRVVIDLEPPVRAHVRKRLDAAFEAACREAHARLFRQYRDAAPEQPETIDELEPLYRAIVHGCHAGLHERAFETVYWPRVSRKERFFSTRELGAYGADLNALASFFDGVGFIEPSKNLPPARRAHLLNLVGLRLQAVGRLDLAADVMAAAVRTYIELGEIGEAATNACNRAQLLANRGDLKTALAAAHESVLLADRSNGDKARDKTWDKARARTRFMNYAFLGRVLHLCGHSGKACDFFQFAERIYREEVEPGHSFMIRVPAFFFCDLLVDLGRHDEAATRARFALDLAREEKVPLFLGVLETVLGRIEFERRGKGEAGRRDLQRARHHGELGVEALREARLQHYLPFGLLFLAEVEREIGHVQSSGRWIDEVRDLARRYGFGLFGIEGEIEAVRLALKMGDTKNLERAFASASEGVQRSGYKRREPVLAMIGAQIADQRGREKAS